MTPNKTRQILAAQKLKLEATPQRIEKLPPLTAAQRREMYAPKPYTTAPQHLQGAEWVNEWQQVRKPRRVVRAAKGTAKATGWALGMLTAIAGGILAGETKRGLHS